MQLINDTYFEFYGHPAIKRGKSRLEHVEAKDVANHTYYVYPDLLLFHVVNEGALPPQYRVKLREMGLMSGVSDYILLEPRRGYHGAMIELKRASKTDATPVSDEQKKFLKWARRKGYFTAVCYGFDEYWKCLLYYLG